MVRTIKKKSDPWRRAKRNYMKRNNSQLTLYPPIWDSCVFYFTRIEVVNYPTSTSVGRFWYIHQIRQITAFANLHAYFGYYRVEKMTVTLAVAEIMDAARIEMATTHDEHGFYATAPTSITIRSMPDYTQYSLTSVPRKTWYMDTNSMNEVAYSQVPDVAEAASINQAAFGGIAAFFTTTTGGSTQNAFSAAIKYKIRFKGRCAVAA